MQQGIIYTRVSSEEQVTGTSLAFQEQLCRRYCEERGITVAALFREEGESAKTADRTELLRALEFCRKHKNQVHAFIVAKVDRFARNTEDHFYVRKLLLDFGVTLHSVTEPIGNKPTEKFVETVLAASAEFDNAIRKQRCTDGLVARIEQGIWPFRSPLGYLSAQHRKRGEKKTRPDQRDPDLFPIIQEGLKAYAAGHVRSLKELGDLFDALGMARLRARPTPPQLIDRIAGKYLDFFAGILVNPWTGERHRGQHEPMITEEESQRIRLIRSGRLTPLVVRRDRFSAEFPLRRTVRCAACGRPLTGAFTKGNGGRYPYYNCGNRGCPRRGKSIPRQLLHSAFRDLLKEITPQPRVMQLFEVRFREAWAKRNAVFERARLQHAHALTELQAKRRRVFEMREDGSYTREMFQERLAEIDRDLAALSFQQGTQVPQELNVDGALTSLRDFSESLDPIWFILPPATRPRFEHLVFPAGVTYERGRGVRTTRLGLIFELNRCCRGTDSPDVHLRGISSNQWLQYLGELEKVSGELNLFLNHNKLA